MPPRCDPPPLFALAKAVLTSEITFRVRVMLHCVLSVKPAIIYLEEKISSLPPPLATEIAQTALRCTDTFLERSYLSPGFLNVLVRTLINDSTMVFEVSKLHSYQLRQAVLTRICELRHLQTYYSLEHFHENVNTFATLQRMQSLSNLKQVYLAHWCSDDIAHLLADSCGNLQVLDAQNSVSLTDSGVASLSRCMRLKVLLVYSTGISNNGYEKLLKSLPLLQKIGPCHRLNFIISRLKKNCESLPLREYESGEIPDENVAFMCPSLTSVYLYGPTLNFPQQSKLSHRVTNLKLQSITTLYLNTILTSNIVHLDLYACAVTQENMTAIANVCDKLRVLRLNPTVLSDQLRLVTHKQTPFRYLEELNIPDSALALDILMVSQRIRQLHIEPQKGSSPFSHQIHFWTDAVLTQILDKNPLRLLHSFYLATSCNFSVKTIFYFLEACPSIRYLGNTRTWGPDWDDKIFQIYPLLRKHNLAVELIH